MSTELVMGMPVTVVCDRGAERVFAWLRWVDATFSTYREDSEIRRIDRGELRVADAHPDVQEVLARCERLRVQTGGYFDARAGGSLDPSGLVKGWAVDRAAALLRGRFMIDAGGDVLLRGGPWRVGVRHPLRGDALCAALELSDAAVATSGAYERGDHVLDPVGGGPARGALSVTVVTRSLARADAYRDRRVRHGPAGPGVDGAAARVRGDDGARRGRGAVHGRLRAPPARLVRCGMIA